MQKQQADLALSHCVAKKTGDELLVRTMYLGVTLGVLHIILEKSVGSQIPCVRWVLFWGQCYRFHLSLYY